MANKDQAKGVGNQIKGAAKDAVGGATGNTQMQAEGKADKIIGKVQKAVGDAKDSIRR